MHGDKGWRLFQCQKELFESLVEASAEEMGEPDTSQRASTVAAGIEAQGGFEMLDCDRGATGEKIKPAALQLAEEVTWVESQGTVHEPKRGVEILAEPTERNARVCEDYWVIGI